MAGGGTTVYRCSRSGGSSELVIRQRVPSLSPAVALKYLNRLVVTRSFHVAVNAFFGCCTCLKVRLASVAVPFMRRHGALTTPRLSVRRLLVEAVSGLGADSQFPLCVLLDFTREAVKIRLFFCGCGAGSPRAFVSWLEFVLGLRSREGRAG